MASAMRLVTGRLGRRGYIVETLAYVVVYLGLAFVTPLAPFIAPWFWIALVANRRLHDFGRSGWWALTPVIAAFVANFVASFGSRMAGFPPGTYSPVAGLVSGAGMTIGLGFTVWLAIPKSDPAENRFGAGPMAW